jgi:hypothetical protein
VVLGLKGYPVRCGRQQNGVSADWKEADDVKEAKEAKEAGSNKLKT